MWGTLPEVLDRACGYFADSIAVVDGDRRITYRELLGWANRVGNGLLALGLQKGERVGLLLPNSLEFIPTQHGIWKSGGVLVQMPTRASASVHRANLEQTEASTLIYHAQFEDVVASLSEGLPKLHRLIRVGDPDEARVDGVVGYGGHFDGQLSSNPEVSLDEHDEAYVLFTSGSTGDPKGVVQSHFTWAHYSISAGLEIGDIRFGEVFAHGAPLTHFTQIFVMPTFLRGGTNVMLPGLEVDGLLAAIEREKVTATAVVPTIVYLLLDHPERARYDLSSLQTMIYAGSPIAPERLRQALEAFGPIFIQTYAGTEPGYVSCLRKNEHRVDSESWLKRLASAGRPMFQVRVSIQDDDDRPLPIGEVARSAPSSWARCSDTSTRRGTPRRCGTAGCTPATSAGSTRTGSSTSWTGRRTWSSAAASTSFRARSRTCSCVIPRSRRPRSSACRTRNGASRCWPSS